MFLFLFLLRHVVFASHEPTSPPTLPTGFFRMCFNIAKDPVSSYGAHVLMNTLVPTVFPYNPIIYIYEFLSFLFFPILKWTKRLDFHFSPSSLIHSFLVYFFPLDRSFVVISNHCEAIEKHLVNIFMTPPTQIQSLQYKYSQIQTFPLFFTFLFYSFFTL